MAQNVERFAADIQRGETARQEGQFQAALEAFQSAQQHANNDTERGIALGKQAEVYSFHLQQHADARRAAESVLRLQTAAPVARVIGLKVKARCQMVADSDHKAAIVTLQSATELTGVDWAQPSILLMLGDCYRSIGEHDEAIATYDRVLKLDNATNSVKATAALNTGMTFQYNLRQSEQAATAYASAAKLNPGLAAEIARHQQSPITSNRKPIVLAHYMPWYAAPPYRKQWGWHWTMNHFNPQTSSGERREIASHYYPMIGPYDSGDEHVLEYHLLLMKLSGIDGVIVDWYGLTDFRDYAMLHQNTTALVKQVQRLNMKFVICYEDQTIPALEEGERLLASGRVAHAVDEIKWLANNWFALDSYVRLNERPVLLSFGHAGLTDSEWQQCLHGLPFPVMYFSEHTRRQSAVGAFDWPIPSKGIAGVTQFSKLASAWTHQIPVVFPRFVDIYKTAQVGPGYPEISDENGATFRQSLKQAVAANAELIQIATWNDWGEGTQIEPSTEFGYRDLEHLQKWRRSHVESDLTATASHLRLPLQLFRLRQSKTIDRREGEEIVQLLLSKQYDQAAARLSAHTETQTPN